MLARTAWSTWNGGAHLDLVAGPSNDRDPLRILVVSNLYPSSRAPAFGTFVAARVAAMRGAGASVSVVAITDPRVGRSIGRKYLRLALSSASVAARARLRRARYDVVEVHIAFPTGLVAWPAARLGGARLVLFCHGSDVTRLPWQSPSRTVLARWLFAHADLVIANSRFTADIATGRLGPLRRPAVVVSPGIDLPPDIVPTSDRDRDHVLFVGRLVPGKGVDVLLEAMAVLCGRIPTVRLTVVGEGSEHEPLMARAAELAIAVTFTGSLPPDQAGVLMRRATVVAVPSTTPEGLGLVALEAMAQGAAVVATALGGAAEVVRDGENGLVVEPGDAQGLATALERVLRPADGDVLERMISTGRTTAIAHERTAATRLSLDRYRALVG